MMHIFMINTFTIVFELGEENVKETKKERKKKHRNVVKISKLLDRFKIMVMCCVYYLHMLMF